MNFINGRFAPGNSIRRPPGPLAPRPVVPAPVQLPGPEPIDMTLPWIVEVIATGADPEQLQRYLQHLRTLGLLGLVAVNTVGRPHRAVSLAWHCRVWAEHSQPITSAEAADVE